MLYSLFFYSLHYLLLLLLFISVMLKFLIQRIEEASLKYPQFLFIFLTLLTAARFGPCFHIVSSVVHNKSFNVSIICNKARCVLVYRRVSVVSPSSRRAHPPTMLPALGTAERTSLVSSSYKLKPNHIFNMWRSQPYNVTFHENISRD